MKCGGKHHTSICFGKREHEEPRDGGGVDGCNDATQVVEPRAMVAKSTKGIEAGASAAVKPGTVLLQTACAEISNPKTGKTVRSRIILDIGSHFTYITRRLQQELKFNMIAQDLDPISWTKYRRSKREV